jgi:dipeptidyl aminopeptidase/acylaminoacyl peptidase
MLSGTADYVCTPKNQFVLAKALAQHSIPHEVVVLEQALHNVVDANPSCNEGWKQPVQKAVNRFFERLPKGRI